MTRRRRRGGYRCRGTRPAVDFWPREAGVQSWHTAVLSPILRAGTRYGFTGLCFDPGEPRLPAGSGQGGGEWTEGDASPVVPAADRRGPTADEYRRGDFNRFFDTLYPPVHALAQRLGIDETWLLGLAAYESYWLGPHDRRLNNPFGTTHGGGPNVGYGSIGAAVAYWEARFGPAVRGAVSAEDFAQRLWQAHYNRKTPNWREQLIAVIRSVPRNSMTGGQGELADDPRPSPDSRFGRGGGAADFQIPLASNHFTNPDYGFAVEIPPGLMGCVSDEGADHGVSIPLERDSRCKSYRRKPHVDIYAEYNMPGDAKTPLQRARIECPDPKAEKIVVLKGWRLGGRGAAGCLTRFRRKRIRLDLFTLHEHAAIVVGASLTTTAGRYRRDLRVFRRIVGAIRLAPEAPGG